MNKYLAQMSVVSRTAEFDPFVRTFLTQHENTIFTRGARILSDTDLLPLVNACKGKDLSHIIPFIQILTEHGIAYQPIANRVIQALFEQNDLTGAHLSDYVSQQDRPTLIVDLQTLLFLDQEALVSRLYPHCSTKHPDIISDLNKPVMLPLYDDFKGLTPFQVGLLRKQRLPTQFFLKHLDLTKHAPVAINRTLSTFDDNWEAISHRPYLPQGHLQAAPHVPKPKRVTYSIRKGMTSVHLAMLSGQVALGCRLIDTPGSLSTKQEFLETLSFSSDPLQECLPKLFSSVRRPEDMLTLFKLRIPPHIKTSLNWVISFIEAGLQVFSPHFVITLCDNPDLMHDFDTKIRQLFERRLKEHYDNTLKLVDITTGNRFWRPFSDTPETDSALRTRLGLTRIQLIDRARKANNIPMALFFFQEFIAQYYQDNHSESVYPDISRVDIEKKLKTLKLTLMHTISVDQNRAETSSEVSLELIARTIPGMPDSLPDLVLESFVLCLQKLEESLRNAPEPIRPVSVRVEDWSSASDDPKRSESAAQKHKKTRRKKNRSAGSAHAAPDSGPLTASKGSDSLAKPSPVSAAQDSPASSKPEASRSVDPDAGPWHKVKKGPDKKALSRWPRLKAQLTHQQYRQTLQVFKTRYEHRVRLYHLGILRQRHENVRRHNATVSEYKRFKTWLIMSQQLTQHNRKRYRDLIYQSGLLTQLDKKATTIAAQRVQLSERDAALHEQSAELASLREQLSARDAAFHKQGTELTSLGSQLSECDAALHEQGAALESQHHQLSKLEASLHKQSAELASLREQLSERDAELHEQGAVLASRCDQVRHLQRLVPSLYLKTVRISNGSSGPPIPDPVPLWGRHSEEGPTSGLYQFPDGHYYLVENNIVLHRMFPEQSLMPLPPV